MTAPAARSPRSDLLLRDPISRLIPKMALPTIASQLITTIYNLSDTYFVSVLGTSAAAAVGVNGALERTIMLVGSLIGSGACSYIARLLGGRRKPEADTVLSTSLFTGLALGLILTAAGLLFMRPLVFLLGATEDCAGYAMQYARFVLLAAPFMVSSMILNMCLRNEGSATLAMAGIGIGAILNIILDPILIFGLGLGVTGASAATAISKLVSFCILLWPYFRGKTTVSLALRYFRYRLRDILEVLGIGATAFFRTACMVLSGILLNRIAGASSTAALAAMSIANRVMEFPFSIILGFGQGYQPVVGYNYGAGAWQRVREALRFGSLTAIVGGALMGGALFLAAPQVIRLFNRAADPDVLELGTLCVRLQSAALPLQGWGMIVNMYFAGTGGALCALVMSTARQGYCLIPVLLILPAIFGVPGLAGCQAAADLLSMGVALPLAIYALYSLRARERQSFPEEAME